MTPLKPLMKSRIPQLYFCLKYRYGMGILTYEIVLLAILFKKNVAGPKQRFKISTGVNDPAEIFFAGSMTLLK
jgi:hypothetical protein